MNPINKDTNASYNFVAPSIEEDAGKKVEPVFPTSEAVIPTISSNADGVHVRREKTIINLGTRSAATTLKLAPESGNLNIGAVVYISWTSDSTARNVTVKIGTTTIATLSGTASTAVTKMMVWDGTSFLAV